jgi:hypothetical protein
MAHFPIPKRGMKYRSTVPGGFHTARRGERHVAGIERLAPRPVVRRIGIDEGDTGWQVYAR